MISVVVPVRNGMPWLEEQLRALAAQQCAEPWEVVVADNGSDRRQRRGGPRDGPTGHDDRPRGRRLGRPRAGGGPQRRRAGRPAATCWPSATPTTSCSRGGWPPASRPCDEADVVAGVFDFWSLNGRPASALQPAATRQLGFLPAGLGANLAVRRRAFEAVGGFDEELVIGEDIDLCWRLQLRGFRFVDGPGRRGGQAGAPRASAGASGRRPPTACSGPALYRRHRPDRSPTAICGVRPNRGSG